MAQLPSIPKGTRDYSPEIMVKRNYIFDTIKSVFKLYGYMPLETPAMENLSTLMGKYGEEGDKLLFKILNSGDFIGNIPDQELVEKNSIKLTNKISEKGLRYDLTVPFARFVVQHQSELTFPFKRYQIQPVWRADRPQKGRYREFYQCDVDVVGSDSLLHEVELIQMVDEVKALDVQIGSITGGGRYDDLTGIFGLKNMSGVGISFGADRIFDVMNQLDLFPKDNMTTTQILFVNFGKQEERYCLPLLKQLREAGINAEIYPEAAKMKKQMTYADKKEIPFVALIGENEMQEGIISLKNMLSGEQHNVTTEELVERLKR